MKKITIFLAALLLVFAAGCREDASLDGLESQTKEEGTSAGETPESQELKALLAYDSGLDYNWVCEYAPAQDKSYTILFNFVADSSVASDSPVSDSERNLALYTVSVTGEGSVTIKFDGQTMLNDECIDSDFRERALYAESWDDNTIRCVGVASGETVVLRKATSADVLALGEKLVWQALSGKNLLEGVLRDADGAFRARYAVDKRVHGVEFTWIDAQSQDAKHVVAPFTLSVESTRYELTWDPVTMNDLTLGSLTYTHANGSVNFDADAQVTVPASATPDYVNKASNQWFLGGKMQVGTAHPTLWSVLASDNFQDLHFYPYPDDIPIRVEPYMADGTLGNYLFVNDYTDNPKTAHYDTEKDWVRFYASTRGDYLKIPTGSENPDYKLDQMAVDLKPFTDFYFHADGLYAVSENDARGAGFYLISKTGSLWVKVRSSRVQEPNGTEPPVEENFLPSLVQQGMVPYGTFFENTNKNFRLHYNLNVTDETADLIWITDTEKVYTDGNYQNMAVNKAQYKTVKVSSTADGVITFAEPVVIGSATYRGLTWANGYKPTVDGEECTIRTPMSDDSHPLEYFFTYPVNKYEGGTKVFIPYSQFCLPTASDGISELTGTDRYLFYPFTQPSSTIPAGPCAIELFAVGKGQRVDLKSFVNSFETHTISFAIESYKVENDRMIFTKGAVTGNFVDQDGNAMSQSESEELAAPLMKLLFAPQGFHVYKAEAVSYDSGKHYFFLVSPDPSYPYWIKIREA